ncbi:MAG: hypothetical protein JXB88_04665 [Spirochaetales bacterium]|nr:hypothetical protein [Spirochaetales bacterium]
MKKTLLYSSIITVLILMGCATSMEKEKTYLFFPVHLGYFNNEDVDDITYDPVTNTFSKIPESATVAFFKSNATDTYKKASSNELFFLTTRKEEINRFDSSMEDLLVMKTGFIEGYTVWSSFISGYNETCWPNIYSKNIYFDMNNIEGEYIETTFAIVAVNIGSTPINTLYIADTVPGSIELNGEIKYATKDLFIPLNIELADIEGIEHTIIEEAGKRIIVYHIIPRPGGIPPGRCVEIIVPIKLLKSFLMRDEYKVEDNVKGEFDE